MAPSVYYLLMAVVLGFAGNTTAMSLAPYAPPPMYRIRASSLYDAGLQQGQLARDRIRGWLASPEMTALLNYTVTDGASVFAELKETNTAEHSELVAELEGLAAGADVPLGSVWAATLINELESLRTNPLPAGHCSDLYAVADSGAKYHGHKRTGRDRSATSGTLSPTLLCPVPISRQWPVRSIREGWSGGLQAGMRQGFISRRTLFSRAKTCRVASLLPSRSELRYVARGAEWLGTALQPRLSTSSLQGSSRSRGHLPPLLTS